MSETHPLGAPDRDAQERPMAWIYAAVLLIEVVVLVALWGFSRYFGQ